jgi:hypothetical protein
MIEAKIIYVGKESFERFDFFLRRCWKRRLSLSPVLSVATGAALAGSGRLSPRLSRNLSQALLIDNIHRRLRGSASLTRSPGYPFGPSSLGFIDS